MYGETPSDLLIDSDSSSHNFVVIMASAFLFRPGVPGAPLPGRAILSMNGLSYGVIRVNTEDKNSALTIQDVGHVMPGGKCPWSGKISYTGSPIAFFKVLLTYKLHLDPLAPELFALHSFLLRIAIEFKKSAFKLAFFRFPFPFFLCLCICVHKLPFGI